MEQTQKVKVHQSLKHGCVILGISYRTDDGSIAHQNEVQPS